jgi:hypothetical protein
MFVLNLTIYFLLNLIFVKPMINIIFTFKFVKKQFKIEKKTYLKENFLSKNKPEYSHIYKIYLFILNRIINLIQY